MQGGASTAAAAAATLADSSRFVTEELMTANGRMHGWEQVPAEMQELVLATAGYFNEQNEGALQRPEVRLMPDKSLGVALFFNQGKQASAEMMRQLEQTPALANSIMRIECDPRRRSVLMSESRAGSMVVYLRTTDYINKHASISSAPAASTASSLQAGAGGGASSAPTRIRPVERSRRVRAQLGEMVGVSKHDYDYLTSIASELLQLQGPSFQPALQKVMRNTKIDHAFEIHTYDYPNALSIDHLEQARSIAHVKQVTFDFFLSTGGMWGALIVVCELPPKVVLGRDLPGSRYDGMPHQVSLVSGNGTRVSASALAAATGASSLVAYSDDSDSDEPAPRQDNKRVRHRLARSAAGGSAASAATSGGIVYVDDDDDDDDASVCGDETATPNGSGGGGGGVSSLMPDWIRNLWS